MARDDVQRNDWMRAYQYMGFDSRTAPCPILCLTVCLSALAPTHASRTFVQQQKLLRSQGCPKHQASDGCAGSGLVKAKAEQEGLDKIFMDAGFEWREPGCSMCLRHECR